MSFPIKYIKNDEFNFSKSFNFDEISGKITKLASKMLPYNFLHRKL